MASGGSVIQGCFPQGMPRAVTPRAPVPVQPRMAQPPVAQRQANGSAMQLPANLVRFGNSTGQPMPPAVQRKMEAVFNASFADVRVHVGPEAAAIGALAFTMGSKLYFAPGQYNPTLPHGQRLLAHELTHVVQQRAGRVRNPFGAGVAVVQDLSLEAEAERMGLRAAMPQAPVQAKAAPVPAAVRTRPGQGRATAIQPCFGACFAWLFGSKKKKPKFNNGYSQLEMEQRLVRAQREDDWLSDTTCSTTAANISGAFATGSAIGSGYDCKSLGKFMNGDGGFTESGVIYRMKLGQRGFSQHEFAVEQMGDECYLIQSWLNKISLRQWLPRARLRTVSELLGELGAVEEALVGKDSNGLRVALARTFEVEYNDKEWSREWPIHWGSGTQELSWEAWARVTN